LAHGATKGVDNHVPELVFYCPDIPQNLGAALRLGAGFDTRIHIIEPCGFPLGDKGFKRAAMDYGSIDQIEKHADWNAFAQFSNHPRRRRLLMTTKSSQPYDEFSFQQDDFIIFGRESAGVPLDVHNQCDHHLVIPIKGRSLNVVISAAIVLSEAIRQAKVHQTASDAFCKPI